MALMASSIRRWWGVIVFVLSFGVVSVVSQSLKMDETIRFNGDIFTLYDGERHHVVDWDHFLSCGYNPSAVREVAKEELEKIPLGKPFMRCPTITQPLNKDETIKIGIEVYTLYWGQRHHISNWDRYLQCGYNPDAIRPVSQEELDSIPEGLPFLRCSSDLDPVITASNDFDPSVTAMNDLTLYVLRDGRTRHLIPSRGAFLQRGNLEPDIYNMTVEGLESFPLGDPISIPGCACLDTIMEISCDPGVVILESLVGPVEDLMCACVCPPIAQFHYPNSQPLDYDRQHEDQQHLLEHVARHPNLTHGGLLFGKFGELSYFPTTAFVGELLKEKIAFIAHLWRQPWPKEVISVPDFHSIRSFNFQRLTGEFNQHMEYTKFSDRIPKLFWRGSATSPKWGEIYCHRAMMCIEAKKSPHIDAGIIRAFSDESRQFYEKEDILRDLAQEKYWAHHRGVISIDGTLNPWGLRWQLATGSVVFKFESNWTNDYIAELIPWIHYIPLKQDFSDLQQLAQLVALEAGQSMEVNGRMWTLEDLERIALNARDLIARFTWARDVERIAVSLSNVWR